MSKKLFFCALILVVILASCSQPEAKHIHSWDNGTVEVETSCVNDGITIYRCKECGNEDIKIEKAPGHIWNNGEVLIEPTSCKKEDGLVLYVCEKCGTKSAQKTSLVHADTKDSYCQDCLDDANKVIDVFKSTLGVTFSEILALDSTLSKFAPEGNDYIDSDGTIHLAKCPNDKIREFIKDHMIGYENYDYLKDIQNIQAYGKLHKPELTPPKASGKIIGEEVIIKYTYDSKQYMFYFDGEFTISLNYFVDEFEISSEEGYKFELNDTKFDYKAFDAKGTLTVSSDGSNLKLLLKEGSYNYIEARPVLLEGNELP